MAAAAEFGDAGGSVGHEDGEQKVYNNFADQQKCFYARSGEEQLQDGDHDGDSDEEDDEGHPLD